MRLAGLEPARVAPLPPQSSVSANSTISAADETQAVYAPVRKRIFALAASPETRSDLSNVFTVVSDKFMTGGCNPHFGPERARTFHDFRAGHPLRLVGDTAALRHNGKGDFGRFNCSMFGVDFSEAFNMIKPCRKKV